MKSQLLTLFIVFAACVAAYSVWQDGREGEREARETAAEESRVAASEKRKAAEKAAEEAAQLKKMKAKDMADLATLTGVIERNPVLFPETSAGLSGDTQAALRAISQELVRRQRVVIDLFSVGDTGGNSPEDQALAQKRIEVVKQFMMDFGVGEQQIALATEAMAGDGATEGMRRMPLRVRTVS